MRNVGVRFLLAAAGIVALATAGLVVRASDDEGQVVLRARLTGFEEVTPKFTAGRGEFRATLSPDGQSLNYRLSWSNLTAAPLFAHIHFGQRGVAANIMTFLCKAPSAPGPSPTPAAQACGGAANTITGTIRAADIGNPNLAADQGIDPGAFANFLKVIRVGEAYVNVHTPKFPTGEIRGQIRALEEEDREPDN